MQTQGNQQSHTVENVATTSQSITLESLRSMEIRYKPSSLWSAQHWQVADGTLTTPKGTQINLSAVTHAHFIDVYAKGRLITEFKLTEPNEVVAITCTDRPNGEQRALCFTFINAVLAELKQHNPELKIRIGYGRTAKYIYSLGGLFLFGFGIALLSDALRRNPEPVLFILGGMFIFLGLLMVWLVSPWQQPPQASPLELTASLFGNPEQASA